MMELAYDPDAVVLVARASGNVSDEDIHALGRAFMRLDTDARIRNKIPATILIVIMDGEPPTAEQRRLMADLWKPMEAPLHLFAMVSKSPVARGVMKVVQWLNPPGSKRRESVHSTFEEAVRWAERERGAPTSAFQALFAQFRRGSSTAIPAQRR